MRFVECQPDEQILLSLLVPEHKCDHPPRNQTFILDKCSVCVCVCMCVCKIVTVFVV
jgi:hypothetical protein